MTIRSLFALVAAAALIAPGCGKKEAPAPKPVEQAQPADEAPTDEAPADEAPADDMAAKDQPADDMAAKDEPTDEAPADEAPADDMAADDVAAKDQPADDMAAKDQPVDRRAASLAVVEASASGAHDDALAAFADDATWEVVGMEPFAGKEAIKTAWTAMAPKNVKAGASRVIVGPEATAVQFVTTGTDPATDKAIGVHNLLVLHWKDGRIASAVQYLNLLAPMMQAGHIPPMEGAPVPAVPTLPTEVATVSGPADADLLALVKKSWEAGTTDEEHEQMMKEKISPDIVVHSMADGTMTTGLEAHMAKMMMWMTGFPNATPEPVEVFGAGDFVVARGRMTGKHEGDLPFAKATGKDTTTDMASVLRFEDGRIVEQWEYWNGAQMAAQLGLLPQGGAAAKPDGADDDGAADEMPKDEAPEPQEEP